MINVFLSYSHDDEKYRIELEKHLMSLKHQGLIESWDDRKINVGEDWAELIDDKLISADIICLLISADFIFSRYCYQIELQKALALHEHGEAIVIPIILRPCDWRNLPFGKLEALPKDGKPIARYDPNFDDAYLEIVEGIKTLSKRILEKQLNKNSEPAVAAIQTQPTQSATTPCMVNFDKLQRPATGKLIGRLSEHDAVQKAFEDPHIAILGIVADGGSGKTAIVYDWLNQLDVDKYGLTHVFAWTFNDHQESPQMNPSSTFFIETFKFFGSTPKPQASNREEEKGIYLEKVLAENRPILVLDGLEAVQEKHDDPDRRGRISNEAVREFFRETSKIRRNHKNRLIILTSRLPLINSLPRYCYHEINLGDIDMESGSMLLKNLGVIGSKNELEATSKENKGHCLSLVLLGNILANWFADKHVRNRHSVYSIASYTTHQTSYEEQAQRVMSFYEQTISKPNEIAILEMMGLFHSAMEDNQRDHLVEHANFTSSMRELSSVEWKFVAKNLEDYGLLSKEVVGGTRERWDCHPLVREHFRNRLFNRNKTLWIDAHKVLFLFFQKSASYMPSILGDLIPLYRAVHHGCLSGEYLASLELYKKRILRDESQGYSTNRLGAATEDIAALQRFFYNGNEVYSSLDEKSIAWLRSRMAFCQTCLGHLEEAIDNRKKQREFSEKHNDLMGASSASEYLSALYAMRGKIDAAEEAAQMAINLALQAGDWGQEMRSRCRLAAALYLQGRISSCGEELTRAANLHQGHQGTTPHLFSDYGLYYRLWLLDTAYTHEEYIKILHESESALELDRTWLAPMGLEILVKGISLWKIGDERSGEILYQQAKNTLDEAGYLVYMPYYFNAMAEFCLERKKYVEAIENLNKAKKIAIEHGMPLFEIDSNLIEARVYLNQGDTIKAEEIVSDAQRRVYDLSYFLRMCEIVLLKAEISIIDKLPNSRIILDSAKKLIDETGRKSLLKRWNELDKILI